MPSIIGRKLNFPLYLGKKQNFPSIRAKAVAGQKTRSPQCCYWGHLTRLCSFAATMEKRIELEKRGRSPSQVSWLLCSISLLMKVPDARASSIFNHFINWQRNYAEITRHKYRYRPIFENIQAEILCLWQIYCLPLACHRILINPSLLWLLIELINYISVLLITCIAKVGLLTDGALALPRCCYLF